MGLTKTLTYVGALLIFSLLLALGFWQLSRMAQKERIEEAWAHSLITAPVIWHAQDALPQAYHHIQLTGRLQTEKTFLIDNQFHDRVPGYHVITPLLLADENYILINRGWIPKTASDTFPACQQTTFVGRVTYPDEKRFILGDNIIARQPQLILQRLDFDLLSQSWHTQTYPFMLLLDENAACGFVRDWSLKIMTSEKHLGYAVQWFALSLCFLILFVKFIYPRKQS